jgi:hypothetical protein
MYNSDNSITPNFRTWYNPIIEISLLPLYTMIGTSIYVLVKTTSIKTIAASILLVGGSYVYSQAIQHIYQQ